MEQQSQAIEQRAHEEPAAVMAMSRQDELYQDLATSDAHLSRQQSN
jgi:hypothetical protein